MQAAVNQLIARQLVLSPDPDGTEDLIIDVPIQRLHQFWDDKQLFILKNTTPPYL